MRFFAFVRERVKVFSLQFGHFTEVMAFAGGENEE